MMSKDLSKQEIDEIVADNMYRTEFLQALMQEMPNIQIIPIGFDER
jgi:hypothetical protein